MDALNEVARRVDAARTGRGPADWEWFPEHAAVPGTQPTTPIILGPAVIEHAEGGERLELLLQPVWTDLGRLAVGGAVNVACWCDTDHATHDVDALRLVADEETSLPEVFRAGAERPTGWLADLHDADHWRAQAGLPARWAR
ncbi:hypothetical protein [Streptomyces sp. NBC_00572]|uniref:hypothetical protein n=1 Tax=Streptomyces sp. NBC_00572 TaxID=2903664 RepID=UPI0022540656|nr:hypothetical protein [Streptomyces sp. NBC_00572]MCX4985977.1 hypothetical protein [Streptomyces sp. NBC_00572]